MTDEEYAELTKAARAKMTKQSWHRAYIQNPEIEEYLTNTANSGAFIFTVQWSDPYWVVIWWTWDET